MIRLFPRLPGAILLCATLSLSSLATAQQSDWKRWRGSSNTDHSPDTGLLKKWPKDGPTQLWVYSKAGAGYSGFTAAAGKLFTMGTNDGKETVLCLEIDSGAMVWEQPLGAILKNDWGDGPRSSPTIDGGHVYAITGPGVIACLQRKSGKKVWSRKMSEFGGKTPFWGYSESILIDGDRLVCAPGGEDGAVIALHKMTGKLIWQAKDFTGKAEYSSVVAAEFHGKKQYVRLLQKKVAGIDAKTGEVIWEHAWPGKIAVIPTPIIDGNRIFINSGYGIGCMMLEIGKDGAKKLWQNKVMKNHHGGVIKVGEYLYGHNDAGWVCQNWSDGKQVWRERSLKKGAVHYADGMLYCVEEGSGVVALVTATEKGFEENSRFTLAPQSEIRARRGRIWVHPVILDGRMFLRDQEHIYCYDVRAKDAGKSKGGAKAKGAAKGK